MGEHEVFRDVLGRFRLKRVAAGNQVVVSRESYASEAEARQAAQRLDARAGSTDDDRVGSSR